MINISVLLVLYVTAVTGRPLSSVYTNSHQHTQSITGENTQNISTNIANEEVISTTYNITAYNSTTDETTDVDVLSDSNMNNHGDIRTTVAPDGVTTSLEVDMPFERISTVGDYPMGTTPVFNDVTTVMPATETATINISLLKEENATHNESVYSQYCTVDGENAMYLMILSDYAVTDSTTVFNRYCTDHNGVANEISNGGHASCESLADQVNDNKPVDYVPHVSLLTGDNCTGDFQTINQGLAEHRHLLGNLSSLQEWQYCTLHREAGLNCSRDVLCAASDESSDQIQKYCDLSSLLADAKNRFDDLYWYNVQVMLDHDVTPALTDDDIDINPLTCPNEGGCPELDQYTLVALRNVVLQAEISNTFYELLGPSVYNSTVLLETSKH